MGSTQPSDLKPTAEIRSAGGGARAGERALTGGLAVSAIENGGGLTCWAQRQGAQALTSGFRRGVRVREAVSCDLGRAIEIGRGRSKPGGVNGCDGIALSRGGEVARVGAGASYGSSEVTGAGPKRSGRRGELTGGVVATRPRSEMGEWLREDTRRVGVTPVRDSGRREGAEAR
jgi:hypothetical protein